MFGPILVVTTGTASQSLTGLMGSISRIMMTGFLGVRFFFVRALVRTFARAIMGSIVGAFVRTFI